MSNKNAYVKETIHIFIKHRTFNGRSGLWWIYKCSLISVQRVAIHWSIINYIIAGLVWPSINRENILIWEDKYNCL